MAIEASAPGRVNLLGEHTDYNDGFVLPVAMALCTRVTVTPRADGAHVAHSADGDAQTYADAVVAAAGVAIPGFDAEVRTDLPVGAGLASSAALEVALARALRAAGWLEADDLELALLAHRAETEHVGIPCGVMDQLAASLGTPGEPLLIDCRSLERTPLALPDGTELLVLDSGVRHADATSGYAQRRAECERAAELLGVEALRDLDHVPDGLPEPLDRRVRHVVTENARVLAARDATAEALGALLTASHASQRDLYEVSTPEVDALASLAERHGALGARLTGGGFGGALVALCGSGESRTVASRTLASAGLPAARRLSP